jgi:hypothetical protein
MSTAAIRKIDSSNRSLLLLLMVVALLLGTLEGIYGRVRYSGDAISYLNVVRAIHAGDWKLAFNPLWGLGYPLVLAAITPLFPQSAAGEWIALLSANLAILAASFCSFYFLVLTVVRTRAYAWIMEDRRAQRLLILGAFTIFLSVELSMDNVSRIGPDLLLSSLVFAASACLVKLREKPTIGAAIALGAISGFGFLVKNIFLPLTIVFAGLVLLASWRNRAALRYSVALLASAAVLMLPYMYGLSWAAGHRSLGESGSLNYAWHVNHLEPSPAFWQGGPPIDGYPIHPPQQALLKPPVYLFPTPFPVTFAPFFNPPYYYQGYHPFFSLKNQLHAFARNGFYLLGILKTQYIAMALAACILIIRPARPRALSWLRSNASVHSLIALSSAGLLIYLMVWVEARYVASFWAILLLVAWFWMLAAQRDMSGRNSFRPSRSLIFSIFILGCAATLLANQHDEDRNVLGNALHHKTMLNSQQWRAGLYLRRIGMAPGDKVATISDIESAIRCTWAYIDNLRIIGQLDTDTVIDPAASNDSEAFWHSSTQDRSRILEIFHRAGARLVFAQFKPVGVNAEGWQHIPETDYWIYPFEKLPDAQQMAVAVHPTHK